MFDDLFIDILQHLVNMHSGRRAWNGRKTPSLVLAQLWSRLTQGRGARVKVFGDINDQPH